MSAKQALRELRAPDERGAEQRAWEVVCADFEQRVTVPGRRSRRTQALALAGVMAVGAVALSPAGATVGRLIGRALGIEHAARALFSLPAPGQLLVSGPSGAWTVAANGSARRLGPWTQASWSPRGRYLAAVGNDRLAAVDRRGAVKWTLTRPAAADPRWFSPSGYRVAYLSGSTLRVVAGDGTGDHLLAPAVAHVAPAWRPAHPYELAYVTARGSVVVRDADTGRVRWHATPVAGVTQLEWSSDGGRVVVFASTVVRVYAAEGSLVYVHPLARAGRVVDGALSPDGHRLALILGGSVSQLVIEDVGARQLTEHPVLTGAGLAQVNWSPDGRWLLASWPAANQWVFVRVVGPPRIAAVSRISQQFSTHSDRSFPALDGWCCSSQGTTP